MNQLRTEVNRLQSLDKLYRSSSSSISQPTKWSSDMNNVTHLLHSRFPSESYDPAYFAHQVFVAGFPDMFQVWIEICCIATMKIR
jgi:hypothetical protein